MIAQYEQCLNLWFIFNKCILLIFLAKIKLFFFNFDVIHYIIKRDLCVCVRALCVCLIVWRCSSTAAAPWAKQYRHLASSIGAHGALTVAPVLRHSRQEYKVPLVLINLLQKNVTKAEKKKLFVYGYPTLLNFGGKKKIQGRQKNFSQKKNPKRRLSIVPRAD